MKIQALYSRCLQDARQGADLGLSVGCSVGVSFHTLWELLGLRHGYLTKVKCESQLVSTYYMVCGDGCDVVRESADGSYGWDRGAVSRVVGAQIRRDTLSPVSLTPSRGIF
jgi:hypothetical protein